MLLLLMNSYNFNPARAPDGSTASIQIESENRTLLIDDAKECEGSQ